MPWAHRVEFIMGALAIPYLERQTLDLASERIDTRDLNLPLFQFFQPRGYRSKEIEIQAEIVEAEEAPIRGWNQPAAIVSPGRVRVIRATPVPVRIKHLWDQDEIALFVRWGELQAQARNSNTFLEADADIAAMIVRMQARLRAITRETVHAGMVGALLGSYVYTVSGSPTVVDYNLPNVTAAAGSPNWNDAASDIVGSMDLALAAFRDLEGQGVNATHVACDAAQVWAYIRKNTALQDPDNGFDFNAIRAFFAGLGDLQGRVSEPDPIWGKRWVPVDGSRLVNGTQTARWPGQRVTLFNPNALAGGGEPVLEHAQRLDVLNPELGPRFTTGGAGIEADPAEYFLRDSWNFVAAVRDRRFVQRFTIATT